MASNLRVSVGLKKPFAVLPCRLCRKGDDKTLDCFTVGVGFGHYLHTTPKDYLFEGLQHKSHGKES